MNNHSSIVDRLRELQAVAADLETASAERQASLERIGAHSEDFYAELGRRPVYQEPGDRNEALQSLAVREAAEPIDDTLNTLHRYVDGIGHNLGSSTFFAYIPSGGLYEAALADYLAAVSNRYAGVAYAAPGAARLEESLLRWLADVVGYPAGAQGDFTSGGSVAALSAIVVAREAHGVHGALTAQSVVYMTRHMHHTFQKALHVAGVGNCIVRYIADDDSNRMRIDRLQEAIAADTAAGLSPWLIAATAGTTDTGSIDPLHELADVARDNGLWLHVDAAYGGAFALCDEGRKRLDGIERSDSMILDPHKGMFLPGGIGVVLVRNGKKMFDAFHARGTYMQDISEDGDRSPCDYSPELTRPFRALRLWLPLRMKGVAPFRAALEEKLLLAQYAHQQLSRMPGVETQAPPDLSICTFRCVPSSGDINEFNRRLVKAIADDGRIFLTSTTIGENFVIRLAILGYNTHLESVDLALSVIEEKFEECQSDSAQ